jgi:hypothetical protein
MKPKKQVPEHVCDLCQQRTVKECSRVECGNRRPITGALNHGMSPMGSGCYRSVPLNKEG